MIACIPFARCHEARWHGTSATATARKQTPYFYQLNEEILQSTSGKSLNDKKIMLGNMYRPPRNIIDDYNTFFSELVPILTQLKKSKSEVVIAGDFNLDLLKLNENNIVSNFFDIITSQMFHPTITLPTRFSDKRCTLIDNFYCKYSPAIMNSTTGILTNNISDHQPYILNIHNLTTKVNVKKYVKLNPQNSNSLINFKTGIQKANIYNTLNKDEGYDHNENYGIMQEIINNKIKTYFPVRVVKFNKRKHKKSNWITKGIINSISFRDKMYRKLKQTSHDSQHFETLKINLRTYNIILKRYIKQAKKAYYQEAFQKHQNDIKSTWRIIKGNIILNKSQKQKNYPDTFLVDGKLISDKLIIAKQHNSYFSNIGQNLASEIITPNNKSFTDYVISPCGIGFNFVNVTVADIMKIR